MFKKIIIFLSVLSVFLSLSFISVSAKEVDTSYIDYVEQQADLSAIDDYSDRILIVSFDKNNNIDSYFLLFSKSEYIKFNQSNSALAIQNQAYVYKLNSDFSIKQRYGQSLSNLVLPSSRFIIYSDFDIYDKNGNLYYSTDNNIVYNSNNDDFNYNDIFTSIQSLFDFIFSNLNVILLSCCIAFSLLLLIITIKKGIHYII